MKLSLFKKVLLVGSHGFILLGLVCLAATAFVPNLRADDETRWCAEAQAAVESWIRSDTNNWFRPEFGDLVSVEGSGFAEPVWNIQGFDYLTLHRTAHFTLGPIPLTIYAIGRKPGTNIGTPFLESYVSEQQGATIFVSHVNAGDRMFTEGIKRAQFAQASQRWMNDGLAAVTAYLRGGTNDLTLLCGNFTGLEAYGSDQGRIGEMGSVSNRYHGQTIYVKAHFSRGFIPLTICVTEGRVTAPGLTNVGTPIIEGPISPHTGARLLVSHPELCSADAFGGKDPMQFVKSEGEAKLVGAYQAKGMPDCSLELRADHTLVLSNCPAPGNAPRLLNLSGNWALSAYSSRNVVLFHLTVSGGSEVQLCAANCFLIYPNHFNPYQTFLPSVNLIYRDASGNRRKLFFRSLQQTGMLPPAMRPNPNFFRRSPTNIPPNLYRPAGDDIEVRLREAIIFQSKQNYPSNQYLARMKLKLAGMLQKRGELAEAETNLDQGLAVMSLVWPERQPDVDIAEAWVVRARILLQKHDLDAAETAARTALKKFTPHYLLRRDAVEILNEVLQAEGKPLESP